MHTSPRDRTGTALGLPVILITLALATAVHAVRAAELAPHPGSTATPSLRLNDLAGRSRALAEFRGQVVLVNFWATWCPPCRAEMPSMWRLKHRLGNRPFQVLAVNMGESPEVVQAFLPQRMQRDFVVLLDRDTKLMERWNITAFPTSFIIDTGGEIRYARHGALVMDDASVVETIQSLMP